MQIYSSRSDVPEKYKWDLTEFCKDDKEFEEKYSKAEKKASLLANYEGCTKDATKIKEFLDLQVDTTRLFEELYVYAHLINDQELGISTNSERFNRVLNLGTKINTSTCFFAPELLKVDEDTYDDMFKSVDGLELYKPFLDRIYREKNYVLNESEERIISELEGARINYASLSSTLLNALHNYGEVILDDDTKETITLTNYGKLMKKCDRKKREEIYKSFFKVIDQYGYINAELLNGFVSNTNTLAKLHHFDNAWEANLFKINIPNKVFENLVNTCENRLDLHKKFYEIKREVLGLDKLYSWDLPLDLVKEEREYSIEDAQELVIKAIEPLGDDYIKKFRRIIDERFVDYCQYKGKKDGGYSISIMDHPSRILMSFNGDLYSVSTLAHEGGHNVNHQYICEKNSSIYSDTTLIVAEVASLVNECLLCSYLKEHGETKSEKLAGVARFLEVFIGNFYSSIREGRLEETMYNHINNGGTLSKDYLDKINQESLSKYFGDTVIMDEYHSSRWIMRSHYYQEFYLYAYAICISIASHVASKILSGDKDMLDSYIKFLGCGLDVWPMDMFKILGVDLEDESIYNSAIKYFEDMLNSFEKLSKED